MRERQYRNETVKHNVQGHQLNASKHTATPCSSYCSLVTIIRAKSWLNDAIRPPCHAYVIGLIHSRKHTSTNDRESRHRFYAMEKKITKHDECFQISHKWDLKRSSKQAFEQIRCIHTWYWVTEARHTEKPHSCNTGVNAGSSQHYEFNSYPVLSATSSARRLRCEE